MIAFHRAHNASPWGVDLMRTRGGCNYYRRILEVLDAPDASR
jgi:hypothetical protein